MTGKLAACVVTVLCASALFPGCLMIRTTEHRIRLNKDGSGEAMMRLIDIRSDAASDSGQARDFAIMMASVADQGIKEFERGGRKVISKKFFASGDTLSAQIIYTFPNLDEIEGLRVSKDEMFVVVNQGREIVRTNGSVESWVRDSHRIVWPRDVKALMYQVTEKMLPPTASLAPLYRKYGSTVPPGAH